MTEGSLSLYAESRKTQAPEASTAEATTAEGELAATATDETGDLVASSAVEEASGGFPMGMAATAGVAVVLAGGAIAFVSGNRKG